jgi:glycosyltransferase involved in cell wall biosynthesis
MAKTGLIKIFTEVSGDADNINAQSLSVRQIVSRLDAARFAVTMTCRGAVDPRLETRANTKFVKASRHGTAVRNLAASVVERPDIYFYPLPSPVTEMFLWMRRNFRLPTKLVVHAVSGYGLMRDFRMEWFGGNAIRKAIEQADVVVGNSRFVSEQVSQEFGRSAETIHNGIDREYFYPPAEGVRRKDKWRLQVLYVGSFRPYKHVRDIVKIAAKYPGIEFTLIGDGEERKACEQMAATSNNVRFLGSLKPAEVGEAMRSADIFLFPSVMEGHPQVLGQAAACGLPCVARDAYRPDYVVHGSTGFLAANEKEFGEYFDLLVCDRELRARLGAVAVYHAQEFDWERSAGQWAEVFERVTQEGAR